MSLKQFSVKTKNDTLSLINIYKGNMLDTSILFSEKQIQQKVSNLARQINQVYGEREILALGILRGAFVFYTDLLKQLEQNIICDFCAVSFYGPSKKASHETTLTLDIKSPVKGKDVLLIDCISDHGYSLEFIRKHLEQRKALSIKTAVLIVKPSALKNTQIDFKGFEIDQEAFIVGYGIDYNNKGRNLKHFAQIKEIN